MKSKYGIYGKYHDSKVAIIDFDETISAGHLHHYFTNFFSELTIQDVSDKARGEEGWLKEQLCNSFLYPHFKIFGITNNIFKQKIDGKSGTVIEALEQLFDFDSESVHAFKDEAGLKALLKYRSENNLKTYVVSSSAYKDVIKETLKLLIGDLSTSIEVRTPDIDVSKTFESNIRLGIYRPFSDKNGVITGIAKECNVTYEDIAFYDDTKSICDKASELGVKTVWIEPLQKLEIRWKVRDELRDSAEGSYESAGEAFEEGSENGILPTILGRSFERDGTPTSNELWAQTSLHNVPTKPAGHSIDLVSCKLESLSLSQDELRSTLTMSR